jgi:hypothetical protein
MGKDRSLEVSEIGSGDYDGEEFMSTVNIPSSMSYIGRSGKWNNPQSKYVYQ